MNKLVQNGMVAVLYSPGFGAGWSTWDSKYGEDLVFDADIARAVLDKDVRKVFEIAEEKYPDAYTGGLGDVVVTWLPEGTRFTIEEYDGSESIRTADNLVYIA